MTETDGCLGGWELYRSKHSDAVKDANHFSWKLTRLGNGNGGTSFTAITTDNRIDPYTLTQPTAPSLLVGIEDLGATQNKINALITQLMTSKIIT